jgi:hypothetical protein
VAVGEQHGIIAVRLDGRPVDVDAALDGALDDLDALGLDRYVHIETRTSTWKMNWRLVLDTFTESYHVRTLHKSSIAATFLSDSSIFEPLGRNLLSVGLRTSVFDEFSKPDDEWSLLPHGTIQYFLVPSGLVVHEVDHVEAWRVMPIDVRTTEVATGIFVPRRPPTRSPSGTGTMGSMRLAWFDARLPLGVMIEVYEESNMMRRLYGQGHTRRCK